MSKNIFYFHGFASSADSTKAIVFSDFIKEKFPNISMIDVTQLVGRVIEVNYKTSRVLLLSDLNSNARVTIAPQNIQAIITGDGDNAANTYCAGGEACDFTFKKNSEKKSKTNI